MSANKLAVLLCLVPLLCIAQGNRRMMVQPVKAAAAAASSPSWTSTLAYNAETTDSSTNLLSITNGAASGRVVVMVRCHNNAQSVSGITDSAGNTYSLDVTNYYDTDQLWIYSAPVSSAISAGGWVKVTWSNPAYSYRWAFADLVSNVTGKDVTSTNGSAYGQTISMPATTTAATAIVGMIAENDSGNTETYTGSNFTISRDVYYASWRTWTLESTEASSGSKNAGGTLNTFKAWTGCWAAYK